MDWKSARSRLSEQHVTDAAEWIGAHCRDADYGNLYERTGCHPPRKRYIEVGGQTFPAKAFGYLALMNAGWEQRENYRPTVNEVVGPLRKFRVKDRT